MTTHLTDPGQSRAIRLEHQVQHLLVAIETELRCSPDGLSELSLIRRLQQPPWELLSSVDFSDAASLYPVHFLLFHSLYRLRDILAGEGESLLISPVRISLSSNRTVAGYGMPAEPDALRSFYLDLSQHGLPENAIREMMEDFRAGRYGRNASPQEVQEAAVTLGFVTVPSDFRDVKASFRRAVMQAHPDRGGSTAQVQALNQAFAILKAHFR